MAADQALRVGERYRLRIAIGPRRVGALGAEAFPEEALSRAFEGRDRLSLQVVVFAPGRDFELPVRQAVLSLPRVGASDEAVLALTPARRAPAAAGGHLSPQRAAAIAAMPSRRG